MSLSRFEQKIGELLRERPEPQREHPQHTANCPPMTRFPSRLRHGWTSDERAHVSQCDYCQKLVSAHWRLIPPDWKTMASFILDPANFPDRLAMERFIEYKNPAIYGILTRFLAGRQLLGVPWDTAKHVLQSVAGSFISLPLPGPLARAEQQARVAFPTFEFTDLRLTVKVVRDEEGALEISVIPGGEHPQPERIWISVGGLGDPITVDWSVDPRVTEYVISVRSAEELVLQQGTEIFIAVGRTPATA